MTLTPGSQDDNPPLILHPGNYEFLAIGRLGDDYSVYRSAEAGVTNADIAARLRDIADRMDGSQ